MKRHATPVLAVDLGGTKIRAGIVGTNFRVRQHRSVTTPTGDSAAILNALVSLLYQYQRSEYHRVAIGFAGLTTWPGGEVMTAPSLPSVTNVPLRRYLKQLLRCPVVVDNDVTLWTLGEATHGAGRRHRVVAGLALGTGVGGGLVIDGQVHRGRNNISEFGHMTIHDAGRADQHGGRGHLESYAGGWAISQAYRTATGTFRSTAEIARLSGRRDRVAVRLLREASHSLALGLSTIINLINPDIIIVGGSVAKAPGLLTAATRELQTHLLHPSLATPVVRATLGNDAPLIGAAQLALTTE